MNVDYVSTHKCPECGKRHPCQLWAHPTLEMDVHQVVCTKYDTVASVAVGRTKRATKATRAEALRLVGY